jgi:hypothetical protein
MSKRPKGTLHPHSLSYEDRQQIVELTRRGVRQREIAIAFSCSVDSIRRIQKKAGLRLRRKLTPRLEKMIVALLHEGHGLATIGKRVRMSQRRIRAVKVKHGIVHRVGDPGLRRSSPAKYAALRAAILRRDDYCNRLAEKYRVSNSTVRALAHKIYGAGRLLSAPVWPPLQSVYPQTNIDVKLENETNADAAVVLVEHVVDKSFHGRLPLPEYRTLFIAALFAAFCPMTVPSDLRIPADLWPAVQERFAANLVTACDCLQRQQVARWQN